MKKRHYPTDSVIYIKVHTYKSNAERLTDADKDDDTRINKNWKKNAKQYCNTALFYITLYTVLKTRIMCSRLHAHKCGFGKKI